MGNMVTITDPFTNNTVQVRRLVPGTYEVSTGYGKALITKTDRWADRTSQPYWEVLTGNCDSEFSQFMAANSLRCYSSMKDAAQTLAHRICAYNHGLREMPRDRVWRPEQATT